MSSTSNTNKRKATDSGGNQHCKIRTVSFTTTASKSVTPEEETVGVAPQEEAAASRASHQELDRYGAREEAAAKAYALDLNVAREELATTPLAKEKRKTRKLLADDNQAHVWVGMTPPIPLSLHTCSAIMYDFYCTKNGFGQTRKGRQCAKMEVITRCKYFYGLHLVDVDKHCFKQNPYTAIVEFDRQTYHPGRRFQFAQLRTLILKYYHPIASLALPPDFLKDNTFFKRGSGPTRLRAWKVQMAAYITLFFIKDVTTKMGNDEDLDSYQYLSEHVYYCFILPVVHTMVMMMDNEPKINLSMVKILQAKPGSWFKRARACLEEKGIWSFERLQMEKAKKKPAVLKASDGNLMSKGMEYTVARILILLSPDEAAMGGLSLSKLWITNDQRQKLYQDYNLDVKSVRQHPVYQ